MSRPRPLPRLARGALLLACGAACGFLAARGGGPGRPGGAADVPPFPADPRYVALPRATPDALMEELEKVGYAGQTARASGADEGVTLHDPERSAPGATLVLASHAAQALLVDERGATLHAWRYPWSAVPGSRDDREGNWRRARLLDDGRCLALFDQRGLIALDRDSRLLWSRVGPFHHDLDVAEDGTLWVLASQSRVVPAFSAERPTLEDFLVHLDAGGRELGRLSLLDAFAESEYAPLLCKAAAGGDVFHTNSLQLLGGGLERASPLFAAGRALVSVWGLDALAIVDLETGRVAWALTGKWHRQHAASALANGHVLLFDNQGAAPWARVLEIDPFTQEIVWAWRGDERNGFLSHVLGSAQRLPNGNTLIAESLRAQAFEVTPAGETVWRFVSPFRFPRETADRPVLLDVERYAPGHPAALVPAGGR